MPGATQFFSTSSCYLSTALTFVKHGALRLLPSGIDAVAHKEKMQELACSAQQNRQMIAAKLFYDNYIFPPQDPGKKQGGLLTSALEEGLFDRDNKKRSKRVQCLEYTESILKAMPFSPRYLFSTVLSCILSSVQGFACGRSLFGKAFLVISNPYALGTYLLLMTISFLSYLTCSYINNLCAAQYQNELLFAATYLFFGAAYLESDEKTRNKIKAATRMITECFKRLMTVSNSSAFAFGFVFSLSRHLPPNVFMPWQMTFMFYVFYMLMSIVSYVAISGNSALVASRQMLQNKLTSTIDELPSRMAYGQLPVVEALRQKLNNLLKDTNKVNRAFRYLATKCASVFYQLTILVLLLCGFFSVPAFSPEQVQQLMLLLPDIYQSIVLECISPFTSSFDQKNDVDVSEFFSFKEKYSSAQGDLVKAQKEKSFHCIKWDKLKLVDRNCSSPDRENSGIPFSQKLYNALNKGKGYYEIRGINGAGKSVLIRYLKDLLAEKCLWIPAHQSFVMKDNDDAVDLLDTQLPPHQVSFLKRIESIREDLQGSVFSGYDKKKPSSGQKVILNLFEVLQQAILDPEVHYVFLDETYANLNQQVIDQLEPLICELSKTKMILLVSHQVTINFKQIALEIVGQENPLLSKNTLPLSEEDFVRIMKSSLHQQPERSLST